MTYRVTIRRSEEGIAVFCPELPGCWSQGATEAEALENIQDAVREYLEAKVILTEATGLTVEQFRKLL